MSERGLAPVRLARALVEALRVSPARRGVAYLAAAAVLMQGTSRMAKSWPTPYAPLLVHLIVLPGGALITYAFRRLENREPVPSTPMRERLRQATAGAGLGAAAFLAVAGVAAARGWVSAPEWGWERVTSGKVATAVALQAIGHLAVAWNEEVVFRGYGFETLREAWGDAAAAGVLVPLFAAAHRLTPQVFLGQAALGAALTALRLHSDGIWMPLGYHWAWNVIQTAVLGASDGLPSLRPLVAHGPYRWLGRLGHPEPGLLSALVNLGVAAMALRLAHRGGRKAIVG